MNLLQDGSPELSSVAELVSMHEDVSNLIDGMMKTMIENSGIGLAANQVGVLKRVIIVRSGGVFRAIINPEIIKRHPRQCKSIEGCLSFPGRKVTMMRSKTVSVKGYDADWAPIRFNASGVDAFCVQHEIDHLNGKTIA